VAKKRSSSPLETFAEDLGKVVGTAENKARGWLDQRKSIAKQLTTVRDKADELLRELTGGAARMAAAVNQARRGRPPGSKSAPDKKKTGRRKFTAAQRKEQAARMKAYWAKRKAASGRKGAKKSRKTGKGTDGQDVGNG
jgi:hypothetical protein